MGQFEQSVANRCDQVVRTWPHLATDRQRSIQEEAQKNVEHVCRVRTSSPTACQPLVVLGITAACEECKRVFCEQCPELMRPAKRDIARFA